MSSENNPLPKPAQSEHENMGMPNLRILPVESLIPHEYTDDKRVDRLKVRLREDGFLKNPPIVAPIPGSDRFVVLDGANRTAAIKGMGIPHLLTQVVDYNSDQVQLLTWHHLITGRTPANFLDEITAIEHLVLYPVTIELAREALAARTILAYIVLPQPGPDGNPAVYMVDGIPGTNHHETATSTALLNAMVNTYKGDPQVAIHRVNSDDMDDLLDYYDTVSGLIVFPPYAPGDIIKLAESGARVPTGITRHIISRRALRVNIEISLLQGPESLEEKNKWWHEQVKHKLANNEIRLYKESTYLFDE